MNEVNIKLESIESKIKLIESGTKDKNNSITHLHYKYENRFLLFVIIMYIIYCVFQTERESMRYKELKVEEHTS